MNLVERLSFEKIRKTVIEKGFPFYESGDFNVNLIGIRSADNESNSFNDAFCVLFYQNSQPVLHVFNATTDPGLYYLKHPMHKKGCAIIAAGHYPALWKVGTHRGTYRALVQRQPVTFYRDNDRDKLLDLRGQEYYARIGLNCHRASGRFMSTDVDKWSAGCQVLADPTQFALMLQLCEISAKRFGNSFSYTLLNEGDLC